MVKSVSQKRKSKADQEIVDVELVDNSKTTMNRLASIMVSIFGAKRISELARGAPMMFLNFSVTYGGRRVKPAINN